MCEVARLVCLSCIFSQYSLMHSAKDTVMVVAVCALSVSVFLIIVLYYLLSLALDFVHYFIS